MERFTESPVRQRLVEVLSDEEPGTLDGWQIELMPRPDGYNFQDAVRGALWAEPKVSQLDRAFHGHLKKKWKRADRALVLLETVRSPEAVSILKEMATGHPDAVPTNVAKEAINNITAVRPKELEALWSDLERSEAEAARALLALFDRGQEGVVFLKQKLKPLAITSDRVNSLLLELNSADEHVWQPAFEELAYFDPRLAIDIPDLMKLVPESPARQRLVAVMGDRQADWLAGSEIKLLSTQDGYHFTTPNRTFWAPAVAQLNTARFATVKRKWTPRQSRDRVAGALAYASGRDNPQGHGHRSSRCPTDKSRPRRPGEDQQRTEVNRCLRTRITSFKQWPKGALRSTPTPW